MAALLGALDAQMDLGVAAIGGKDSMSGTFENIDVPPTLVSFAIAAGDDAARSSAPEFKAAGLTLVPAARQRDDLTAAGREPQAAGCACTRRHCADGQGALGMGAGPWAAWPRRVLKMALGNRIGATH